MADEGCLVVRVLRAASDSELPWKLWPTEVDGVGVLVASSSQPSTSRRTTSPMPVDMTQTSASYTLDLGCQPAGMSSVSVFLDDNANAPDNATSSSDYRDACGSPRTVSSVIKAGKVTLQDFPLAISCD